MTTKRRSKKRQRLSVSIQLTESMHQDLKELAAADDRSMGNFAKQLLQRQLDVVKGLSSRPPTPTPAPIDLVGKGYEFDVAAPPMLPQIPFPPVKDTLTVGGKVDSWVVRGVGSDSMTPRSALPETAGDTSPTTE